MHMTFAAPKTAAPAEAGLHGWLHALSRLGLGLDAGLMAMTQDAPVQSANPSQAPAHAGIPPASGTGTH